MAVPSWFDYKAYFNNKLASLELGAAGVEIDFSGGALLLKALFQQAGYAYTAEGMYQHFVDFGNAEGISPNSWFNTDQYLYNKAADFYNTTAVTPQMVQSMEAAMLNIGMSAWDHYNQYWAENYAKDGTFNNPSSSFDVARYMADKLAQMQKDNPDYTMDMLVEAFQEAGLSPVQHYLAYGAAEGLVPHAAATGSTGSTYQLSMVDDTIIATSADDFFNAEAGTLDSADYIDGQGGNDTLYARLDDDSVEPTITNVENIFFQADGGSIDADRISLAAGETLTIGSVNSSATLVIDDLRHASTDTVVRFQDADPVIDGDDAAHPTNLSVFFNPKYITAEGATSSGVLDIQLMDVRNGQLNGTPLQDNPFDTFTFKYVDDNGKTNVIELDMSDYKDLISGATATYDTLLQAFQSALNDFVAEHPAYANVFNISLGGSFTGQTAVSGTNYEYNAGRVINISSNNGTVEADAADSEVGWGVSTGKVPSTGGIVWGVEEDSAVECPLTQVTVELSGLGHLDPVDDASCLPNLIHGSAAGSLVIGSMADINGIERFDVKVDEASWLTSMASTNEALRMVTVAGQDIDGDGVAENGDLYIGTWAIDGLETWTDTPVMLASGLTDVAVFDAAGYEGNIALGAEFTESSVEKYLDGVDGGPVGNPPVSGYDGFVYNLGSGNDALNMSVEGVVAADNDFDLTMDTGAGNDQVIFQYDKISKNQGLDQKNLQNVTLNTGDGNDTVWFVGAAQNDSSGDGSLVINTGAGNDVIYANRESVLPGAAFVLNASDPTTAGDNVAIGQDTFSFAGGTVDAGDYVAVTVNFLGFTSTVKVPLDAKQSTISGLELNQAIIKAIESNNTLNSLLSVNDSQGHGLEIWSQVEGFLETSALQVSFAVKDQAGKDAGVTLVTDGWYDTKYAADSNKNDVTGDNVLHSQSQVVVDGGEGNDVIVLSHNEDDRGEDLMDIVKASTGDDVLVGFETGVDKLNLSNFLNANKALVTGGTATTLVDNAAVITTLTGTVQDWLKDPDNYGFTTDAPNGAVALVLLHSGTKYTLVQVTNGDTDTAVVMGSITLDANHPNFAVDGSDFTLSTELQNEVYPDRTYVLDNNAAGVTGDAGDDTFTVTGNFAATADGWYGDDTFNIDNTFSGMLNGGYDDDTFNLSTTFTTGVIDGGLGNDTLNVTEGDVVTLAAGNGAGNFNNIENINVAAAATSLTNIDLANSSVGVKVDVSAYNAQGLRIDTSSLGDTITLNGEGTKVDTVVLLENSDGTDSISGFQTDTVEDVLTINAYVTKAGALQSADATTGDITVGTANSIGVLYNCNSFSAANVVATDDPAVNGQVVLAAGQEAFVLVTAGANDEAGTYSMYNVSMSAEGQATVTLVGTLATADDAALTIDNFA